MNSRQTNELVAVLKEMTIPHSHEWFNFEIDEYSENVYFATQCSLEVITFKELIERLQSIKLMDSKF